MNKPKIANYQARGYVEEHRPFIANNIFAEWTDDDSRYVVYSYGKHWPLFIWDAQTQRWYANVSKYSVTTSKHRSTTHPHIPNSTMTYLHVEDMIKVADGGITAIV